MTFPLIGSGVLLGLFLLFKFLPKELVSTIGLTGHTCKSLVAQCTGKEQRHKSACWVAAHMWAYSAGPQ